MQLSGRGWGHALHHAGDQEVFLLGSCRQTSAVILACGWGAQGFSGHRRLEIDEGRRRNFGGQCSSPPAMECGQVLESGTPGSRVV